MRSAFLLFLYDWYFVHVFLFSFNKGSFPLRAWKRAFFVSFIDLQLKRAQKKLIEQTKSALFHARSGNGPQIVTE